MRDVLKASSVEVIDSRKPHGPKRVRGNVVDIKVEEDSDYVELKLDTGYIISIYIDRRNE